MELLRLLLTSSYNWEINNYFQATQSFLSGQLPYQDFIWEYPVSMIYLFMPIYLLTNSIHSFTILYFTILCILYLYFWYLLYQLTHQFFTQIPIPRVQFIYGILAIFLALLANKTFINPDLIPATLVLISLRSLEHDKWSWKTSLYIGIAGAIRIYPFLLFIIYLPQILRSRWWLHTLLLILPALLTHLYPSPMLIPLMIQHVLIFQTQRLPQIGSLPSVIPYLQPVVHHSQVGIQTAYSVLVIDYLPSITSHVVKFFSYLPLLATLGLLIKRRSLSVTFYQACFLFSLLTISLILPNPVFSPQYLIWLWAPVLISIAYLWSVSRILSLLTMGTFLLLHLFTTLSLYSIFPTVDPGWLLMQPHLILPHLGKIICLIALYVVLYLGLRLQQSTSTTPKHQSLQNAFYSRSTKAPHK